MKVTLTATPKMETIQLPLSKLSIGDKFIDGDGVEYEVLGGIRCDGDFTIVMPVDKPIKYVKVDLVRFVEDSKEVLINKPVEVPLGHIPPHGYFFTDNSLWQKLPNFEFDNYSSVCNNIKSGRQECKMEHSVVIPSVIKYVSEED